MQPGFGVREVAEAAFAHLEALAQARAHVQHAGAVGTAEPLLTGARIRVAAERVHVHGDRAHALRPVEQHGHVHVGQLAGRLAAAHPADVRAGDQTRGGTDLFGDPRERDFTHRQPAQLARRG